ncbi:hypothetical protein CSIRO_0301 [Bradyrhizobiaceae bacterium SG-6C]|nr:hypothetical protein CSIRO_0301 [Bradyrhizobiaceae bacterium SG-6C]
MTNRTQHSQPLSEAALLRISATVIARLCGQTAFASKE